MTSRSRWLALLGMSGLGLGVLRNQHTLAWLSLSVMVWLFVEWLWFHVRIHWELSSLQIRRSINGRSARTGLLWAGRTISIDVEIDTNGRTFGPMLIVHDCVPENLNVEQGECEIAILTRTDRTNFSYQAKVLGAGQVQLSGFRITLQDPNGFFATERFVPFEQKFRVLPAYANLSSSHPMVKRMNSLPQHGIHRLQRAGLGSELLELREYVPGDPPKSIAWKVSARRDTLMTRQYESEVPVRVYLFVDGSISTRTGGFGQRLLDQMLYVAGTVARSSISAGDPVGAVLFDEQGQTRRPPHGGERGFYQLLEALSDFASNPPPPRQRLSTAVIDAALRLAGERHPELLNPKVNQVPFTWLPVLPWNRRRRYRCTQLAGVLAELYDLTPTQMLELVHNDHVMAKIAQRFLTEAGVSWMEPLLPTRSRSFHDGIATMELLSKAITESVTKARDNEVYVVIANLLECATNISQLLPAVKMAMARHHRVVFVCPTPTFHRPADIPELPANATAEDMLERAENLRTKELSSRLNRTLRRAGATVALSGEEQAIRLILAETELARSGRTSLMRAR